MAPGPSEESIVFLGSGAFGLPVLEHLHAAGRVTLVVSQPDRPAGRGLEPRPTPVAAWALEHGAALERASDVNHEPLRARLRAAGGIFVIIAFGQKLAPSLIEDRFAINLHGSLLPRWRGAAPIQRAVMEGDREVGVSVISIAERMDAGLIYGAARTEVGASETSGELHDRLARLGPAVIDEVLRRRAAGRADGVAQDETKVTRAPKLARSDAWVDFALEAQRVAARINGLAPWPGCEVVVDGLGEATALRLLRARARDDEAATHPARAVPADGPPRGTAVPGTLLESGLVACGRGAVEIIDVQSPGGRVMDFESWRRGRRVARGAVLRRPSGEKVDERP